MMGTWAKGEVEGKVAEHDAKKAKWLEHFAPLWKVDQARARALVAKLESAKPGTVPRKEYDEVFRSLLKYGTDPNFGHFNAFNGGVETRKIATAIKGLNEKLKKLRAKLA